MAFTALVGSSLAQPPQYVPKVSPAGPSVQGKSDLIAITSHAEDFSTFVAAVEAAGLTETLKGEGPFTLFAPPNSAFEALPEDTMTALMKPENKEKLAALLQYHVWPVKKMVSDIIPEEVRTLQGRTVTVKVDGPAITINGARVTKTDVNASNGVIHVIDRILLPPED